MTTARRADPALWEAVKAEIRAGSRGGKPGQWSARKAQLAVAAYKAAGGGYVGPKRADNALAAWTAQDWTTRSGRPSLETGERYLPRAALAALSPAEYAATTRAKRAGMAEGRQFVRQPPTARAVARATRRPEVALVALGALFAGAPAGTLGQSAAERRGVLAVLASPSVDVAPAVDGLLAEAVGWLGRAEVERRLRAYGRGL